MNKIRKLLCSVLGWHKPTYRVVKGINTHSYCMYCEKEIIRDSQGNWFEIK